MSKMSDFDASLQFQGADAIKTTAQAHIYIRSRLQDAVTCYQGWANTAQPFKSAIELAQHLKRYW